MDKEEILLTLIDNGEVVFQQFGFIIKIEESSEEGYNGNIYESRKALEEEESLDGGVYEGTAEEAIECFIDLAKDHI